MRKFTLIRLKLTWLIIKTINTQRNICKTKKQVETSDMRFLMACLIIAGRCVCVCARASRATRVDESTALQRNDSRGCTDTACLCLCWKLKFPIQLNGLIKRIVTDVGYCKIAYFARVEKLRTNIIKHISDIYTHARARARGPA